MVWQLRVRKVKSNQTCVFRSSTIFDLAAPLKKEFKGWYNALETLIGKEDETLAVQQILDGLPCGTSWDNKRLWTVTFQIFGESPYSIFSRMGGMMYLAEGQPIAGDTSPVFTSKAVDRLLSIICHPFLNGRSNSETLRLFLQFSVIVRIDARAGWTQQFAKGQSDCLVLDALKKEMAQVSKSDHPAESIYERFTRLTKSHPASVETLLLSKIGHFAHTRTRESNQEIQKRQEELYNREGICAVTYHELDGIRWAIDNVASANQEMSTHRAVEAFFKANRQSLYPSKAFVALMQQIWIYESCLWYKSQQTRMISAEENAQQTMNDIGPTQAPKSPSDGLAEVNEPDQSNMGIEHRVTQEVIAIGTEDIMACCAAVDDAPGKSLAELWMNENPFELPA
ncbi:unnamed protein product [Clonostachys rosea]|uniref:Uncharacterized protein n=1 Tax=Bionectria ochroleuca TaxID=29856 RepID=A0ABY6USD2_BIOOC|nr:unnamed protein product [Clonostachys rosea]